MTDTLVSRIREPEVPVWSSRDPDCLGTVARDGVLGNLIVGEVEHTDVLARHLGEPEVAVRPDRDPARLGEIALNRVLVEYLALGRDLGDLAVELLGDPEGTVLRIGHDTVRVGSDRGELVLGVFPGGRDHAHSARGGKIDTPRTVHLAGMILNSIRLLEHDSD